jgi:metal-sulfur cluster biosynthetic enzyme
LPHDTESTGLAQFDTANNNANSINIFFMIVFTVIVAYNNFMSTEGKNVGFDLTLNDVVDHEPTRLEYIEAIKEKLKTVYDPELPIDIYQLGLIYDIRVTEAGHCFVLHTLTSAFCPAADQIPRDIQMAVESIPGIKKCHTRITMTPPWTQESIDPAVRELLFGY